VFQSHVFFKYHPCHSIIRKRDCQTVLTNIHNLSAFAEGEGAAATSLGILEDLVDGTFRLIHRVPSVEGVTATSLGSLSVVQKYIKINRKSAPNELFLSFDKKTIGE
jgi:hypothetical protein